MNTPHPCNWYMQGVKIVPALQAIAVGLAIRFLIPIPETISVQVCVCVCDCMYTRMRAHIGGGDSLFIISIFAPDVRAM